MESESSKKGLIVGLIVALLVIVGFVAINQSDPEPISTYTDNQAATQLVDGDYQLVAADSEVEWEGAKTLVVDWSHEGQVDLIDGNLSVVDGDLAGGEFRVDMTSITVTGDGSAAMKDDKGLIKHFESDDWFSVAKYPEAKFVITNVSKTGDNQYQITGDMTIKETTKQISFPATVTDRGGVLVADATIMIDRTDFDIRFGSGQFFEDLGDKAINDEFSLDIHLEAAKS